MAVSLDWRTRLIPPDVVTSYAFPRRLTMEEGELRLRAILQMQERIMQLLDRHGELPRWTVTIDGQVRFAAKRVVADVERLCGIFGVGEDEQRMHASFVALMFFDDDADITDAAALRRIPRSWWATPLGQLCDRVVHVAD